MNQLTNPEVLEAWKNHSLTREFLQYLRDRQGVLMEAWSRGVAADQSEAVFLGEVLHLSSDTVAQFYDVEVKHEQ